MIGQKLNFEHRGWWLTLSFLALCFASLFGPSSASHAQSIGAAQEKCRPEFIETQGMSVNKRDIRTRGFSAEFPLALMRRASHGGTLEGATTAAEGAAHDVALLRDADRAAYLWAQNNPTGIAIPVRIGADTLVPSSTVERVLRSDFEGRGVQNIRFFFEQGGRGETTVRYVTKNHIWGPYALETARDHVERVASQHQYEMQRGLN